MKRWALAAFVLACFLAVILPWAMKWQRNLLVSGTWQILEGPPDAMNARLTLRWSGTYAEDSGTDPHYHQEGTFTISRTRLTLNPRFNSWTDRVGTINGAHSGSSVVDPDSPDATQEYEFKVNGSTLTLSARKVRVLFGRFSN